MKIVTVASVLLFLAALELYRVGLPSGIPGAAATCLAMAGLSLYLIWQGWASTRDAEKARKLQAEAASSEDKVERLEAAISAAAAKETELQTQFHQARQEVEALRTSLKAKADRSEAVNAEIVNFLSLLQRKGRFIDFLMDDITRYDDKQVGAAARIVHQGCSEVLREYFHIEPVRNDAEGVAVTLDRNYDSDRNRLVGKVVGNPPFKGVVVHRGWKTTRVTLPRVVSAEAQASREIIQPAEIELT